MFLLYQNAALFQATPLAGSSLADRRQVERAKKAGTKTVERKRQNDPKRFIEVNQHRWEIEECFRIMKSEFQARPIYLKLQEMNFVKYEGKSYQLTYTRTKLTDALHEAFGFCTSKEIVPVVK